MPPVSVTMQARNLPEPLTLPAAGWADPPPAVVPEDAAVVAEDPPALGAALVEDVPAPEVPDWPEVLGLELPHAAAAMASTATPAATLIAPTRGRHLRAQRASPGLTSDWVNIAPPSLAPSLGSGPLLKTPLGAGIPTHAPHRRRIRWRDYIALHCAGRSTGAVRGRRARDASGRPPAGTGEVKRIACYGPADGRPGRLAGAQGGGGGGGRSGLRALLGPARGGGRPHRRRDGGHRLQR